jgi:hypothetical protein
MVRKWEERSLPLHLLKWLRHYHHAYYLKEKSMCAQLRILVVR